jgi:hypothetical protein
MLHFGSSYTNRHKWNNFVALSFRVALSKDGVNPRKNKIQQRMMDTVIRDIDIVTKESYSEAKILPVYWEGKKIQDVYFVAEISDDNYVGNGSYEQPFSRKELMRKIDIGEFQKKETDLIIPIKIDETFSEPQYQFLVNRYSVIDVRKHDVINFVTADKTSFCIDNIKEHFPEFDSKKLFISKETNTPIDREVREISDNLASEQYNYPASYYESLDYSEFSQEDSDGYLQQNWEMEELEVNEQNGAPGIMQSPQKNAGNVPQKLLIVTKAMGTTGKIAYVDKIPQKNKQKNKPKPNGATATGKKSIIQVGACYKTAGRTIK